MDLVVLAKVLWRKAWILLVIPAIAALAAFLFTMDLKQSYISTAQVATGFTVNDQVQITEEKFNIRDAEVKFSNLLNAMNSGLSMNFVSYRLLLHDLNPKEKPFHSPDPETFVYSPKEAALVRQMVQRKLDNMEPLSTSDPDFELIRDYLEAYQYGYNTVKENILIDRIPNTDFIEIQYSSDNPALSAFAANSFTQEFLKYSRSLKTERSGESVDFLKQLADNKKAELDAKLENQKQFKSSNGVLSEGDNSLRLSQLSNLEMQRDASRTNIHRLELMTARLRDDINRLSSPVTSGNNQRILDLRGQINRVNERYITGGSQDSKLLDSLNYLRSELQSENERSMRQGASIPQGMTVADLQMRLRDTEIELQVERSNLSMIESKIGNLQFNVSGYASKEARLSALQSEVELAQQEYLQAIERFNQAKTQMQAANSLRQVLIAVPPANPESSKRLLIIGLAAFTSMALCFFVIVGLELIDGNIRTPDRFKRMIGLPILGVMNRIDSKHFNIRAYFNQQNGDEETEMYKSLLRKLRHEIESLNGKVFLFTSPRRRDGKTFVMFSVAYVLSLIDKRVLIVDTNFKNNSLSQLLGRQGDLRVLDSKKHKLLVEATEGQGDKIEQKSEKERFEPDNSYDLIHPTKYKNIYIVGNSGGGHESPAEILSGRDFGNLIVTLSDSFDYVLMEGAALNEYSDTKELVRYSDKVISVFSSTNTVKQMDRDSIYYFKALGKKYGGSILNRVETRDLKL